MDNLTQLTTAHSRTMLMLNEAERWLIASYNPDQEERLYTLIQELTDTAEHLTGQIHDMKKLLDEHDCTLSAEDGCMCVFLRGEEEEEEEIDIDELRLESIRADVEAEQAYDLDEGVVITTTKTLNMPIYYEDDEVIIH